MPLNLIPLATADAADDRAALPRDLARHARALLADAATTADHLLGTADCWDALAMAGIAPAAGRPEDFARAAHMLRMVAEIYAPAPLSRRWDDGAAAHYRHMSAAQLRRPLTALQADASGRGR